ncbi:TadE/TadG family type IV pilus assembly protein [Litorimonas sp. RW-G-Af-16]|uniref:TadE/TadG family type IV pilus assembly protein n=1 Tax=Litorimonas sp. RW-G-Af-16 TaxID=3241168 RepID=UPI00390C441A
MKSLRTYRKDERGAVAVEAVFIVPLLIALGLGAVDSSLLILNNHRMETGLTAAGNYLARTGSPQALETRAKRLAVTGQLDSGHPARITGWSASDVTINYRQIANPQVNGQRQYRGSDVVQIIELSSEHTYQGIGVLKSIFGGSIKLKATHQERVVGSA